MDNAYWGHCHIGDSDIGNHPVRDSAFSLEPRRLQTLYPSPEDFHDPIGIVRGDVEIDCVDTDSAAARSTT